MDLWQIIRVWRSPGARGDGTAEVAGSNPATLTFISGRSSVRLECWHRKPEVVGSNPTALTDYQEVAQSGSAPPLEGGGWEFDPPLPDLEQPVAR